VLSCAAGRIDLGFVTSLSSRFVYQISENLSMKLSARVGTSGIDGELGLSRRYSPTTVLYAGTVVGYSSGTQFKLRYSRAGQVFEFPILLSEDYTEWQMFAAATLLPPLASFLLMRYVVRPLKMWSERRSERRQRQEQSEQLRSAAERAAAERALLQPVARRKMLAEASAGGLVILEAAYGVLHEYRLARTAAEAAADKQQHGQRIQQPEQQQRQQASPRPDTHPQPDAKQQQAAASFKQPADKQTHWQQQDPVRMNGNDSSSGGGSSNGALREGHDAADVAAAVSSSSKEELPPGWLDVTAALQYLVSGGKLELPAGVSKLGLMGFADVAPQADKELYVAYCHDRQLYEKVVGDKELLRLPGAGELVCEEAVASRLWLKYNTGFTAAATAAAGTAGAAAAGQGNS
jgi:DnaJ family protein C protein 11